MVALIADWVSTLVYPCRLSLSHNANLYLLVEDIVSYFPRGLKILFEAGTHTIGGGGGGGGEGGEGEVMSSVTGQYNGYLVPILLLLLLVQKLPTAVSLTFKEPGSRAGKMDKILEILSHLVPLLKLS
jgi:hypothetical protein